MNPSFSERTFEFCFNAQYCNQNAGILATHPYIPSQQQEKHLGYDVEFKIQSAGYTTSIFIQHKVSYSATVLAGTNRKFYEAHNGPYFRFAIDNDQHNVLCNLSASKGNTFYCAPIFNSRTDLERHFRADTIGNNSLLLDPRQVGSIRDQDRHNITYDPSGGNATLHSEKRRFEKVYRAKGENKPELRRGEFEEQVISKISEMLEEETSKSKYRRYLTPQVKSLRPTAKAQYLLGHVYQVSWLLLP